MGTFGNVLRVLNSAGNRKFTLNSATANPKVCDRFAVTFLHFFNRKCTLHFRKLRSQYLLLFCPCDDLFLWRSNFAVAQTFTSKKRSSTPKRLPPNQKIRASTSKRFYR